MIEKLLVKSAGSFKRPWLVILLLMGVAVGVGLGIPKITFDTDVKSMLPATNPSRVISRYYEDQERFGSSDLVFIGVESKDSYSPETLAFVKALKDDIEQLGNLLPAKNLAALLGLSEEEAAKVVLGLREQGVSDANWEEMLPQLLKSSEALAATMSWEEAFARRVVEAAGKVPLKRLFEMYRNPIDKVQSLVNADYVAYEEDSLAVKKLVEDEELTPENIEGLKKRVESWEIYQQTLVSEDATMTSVLVRLTGDDHDINATVNAAITEILHKHASPEFSLYLTGEPVINEELSNLMFEDMKTMIPLVAFVVLAILFLCFRNLLGVVYPGVVIGMSVAFTLGLMGYTGVPISIVGTTIPVLLVAIVSAYCIHQVNHYLHDERTDKYETLLHNMKTVGLAILLSGITVMVGFGALAVEEFVPIRNFGIFTAIGDLMGLACALYALPAFLMLGKKTKRPMGPESSKGWVSSLLALFVKLNHRHSGKVLALSGVLCAVFIAGSFLVKTELNNVSFFKKASPIHAADDRLNEKLAGTMVLNVILDSDLSDPMTRKPKPKPAPAAEGEATDAAVVDSGLETGEGLAPAESGEVPQALVDAPIELTTPAVLNKVEQFQKDVQATFPYVRKVSSFNTILKKMHQEMNDGNKEFYAIPGDKDLIAQYLMIFTGDLKSVLTPDHDKLRISIIMQRVGSAEVERVKEFCQGYFDAQFLEANHAQVQISGTAHLYDVANTLLVDGMLLSIVLCLAIVFVLLLIVLRSFWMSLVALTPIFVGLIINFGTLGLFGIPLNIGTAIVSSIAIGIGVDYSIHFVTWYRNELKRSSDIGEALEQSITHKGRAILYNMFVIFGGFLVLMASQFVPLIQFGGLVALCMVTTAVGALVIVPAVIRGLSRWQLRFLKLGVSEKSSQ